MYNFLNIFLKTPKNERRRLVQSWLHLIQMVDKEVCFLAFDYFDFDLMNSENRIDIVKLVVKIRYNFGKRFGISPIWGKDPRLKLSETFKEDGYDSNWFFFGPQVFFDHNCFINPSSLNVM